MAAVQGFLQTSALVLVLLMVILLWQSVNSSQICNAYGYYCHNATHYINCMRDSGGGGVRAAEAPSACPRAGLCADNLPTRCQSAQTNCGSRAHVCLDATHFQLCVETSVGTVLRMGDVEQCGSRMRCRDDSLAICVGTDGTPSASVATPPPSQFAEEPSRGFHCLNESHYISREIRAPKSAGRCPPETKCIGSGTAPCVKVDVQNCGPFGHACVNTTHFKTCVVDSDGHFRLTGQVDSCPQGSYCKRNSPTICDFPKYEKEESLPFPDPNFDENIKTANTSSNSKFQQSRSTDGSRNRYSNSSFETVNPYVESADRDAISNRSELFTDESSTTNNSSNFSEFHKKISSLSLEPNIDTANNSKSVLNISMGSSENDKTNETHSSTSNSTQRSGMLNISNEAKEQRKMDPIFAKELNYTNLEKYMDSRKNFVNMSQISSHNSNEFEVDEIWTTDENERHYHSSLTIYTKNFVIILQAKRVSSVQSKNDSIVEDNSFIREDGSESSETTSESSTSVTNKYNDEHKNKSRNSEQPCISCTEYNVSNVSNTNIESNSSGTNINLTKHPEHQEKNQDNSYNKICHENGKFLHPSGNLSLYYCCVTKGEDFVTINLTCPPGSVFNTTSKNCVLNPPEIGKIMNTNSSQLCERLGKFSSPSGNCSQFYVCMPFRNTYVTREFLCPAGSEFNSIEMRCTIPQKANCSVPRAINKGRDYSDSNSHSDQENLKGEERANDHSSGVSKNPNKEKGDRTTEYSSNTLSMAEEDGESSSTSTEVSKLIETTTDELSLMYPETESNQILMNFKTTVQFTTDDPFLTTYSSTKERRTSLDLTERTTEFPIMETPTVFSTMQEDPSTLAFTTVRDMPGEYTTEKVPYTTHFTTEEDTISISSVPTTEESSPLTTEEFISSAYSAADVYTTSTQPIAEASATTTTVLVDSVMTPHSTTMDESTPITTVYSTMAEDSTESQEFGQSTTTQFPSVYETEYTMPLSKSITEQELTTQSVRVDFSPITQSTTVEAVTTLDPTTETETIIHSTLSETTLSTFPIMNDADLIMSTTVREPSTTGRGESTQSTEITTTAYSIDSKGNITMERTSATTEHEVAYEEQTTTMEETITGDSSSQSFTGAETSVTLSPASQLTSQDTVTEESTTIIHASNMYTEVPSNIFSTTEENIAYEAHTERDLVTKPTTVDSLSKDYPALENFTFEKTTEREALAESTIIDEDTTLESTTVTDISQETITVEEMLALLSTTEDVRTMEPLTEAYDTTMFTVSEIFKSTYSTSPDDTTPIQPSTEIHESTMFTVTEQLKSANSSPENDTTSIEHSTKRSTSTNLFTTDVYSSANSIIHEETSSTEPTIHPHIVMNDTASDNTSDDSLSYATHSPTEPNEITIESTTERKITMESTSSRNGNTGNTGSVESLEGSVMREITTTDYTKQGGITTTILPVLEDVHDTMNPQATVEERNEQESGSKLEATKVTDSKDAVTANDSPSTTTIFQIYSSHKNQINKVTSDNSEYTTTLEPHITTKNARKNESENNSTYWQKQYATTENLNLSRESSTVPPTAELDQQLTTGYTFMETTVPTLDQISSQSTISTHNSLLVHSSTIAPSITNENANKLSSLSISPIDDSSTTTESNGASQFHCTESGKFPNKNDNTTYYVCSPLYGGGLRVMKFTCPAHSHFYELFGQCAVVQWVSGPETTAAGDARLVRRSAPEQHAFQCQRSGRFPDPWSCTRYHVCASVEDRKMPVFTLECPLGTSFDPVKEKCASSFSCGEVMKLHGSA